MASDKPPGLYVCLSSYQLIDAFTEHRWVWALNKQTGIVVLVFQSVLCC